MVDTRGLEKHAQMENLEQNYTKEHFPPAGGGAFTSPTKNFVLQNAIHDVSSGATWLLSYEMK